jgi:hypothetical protein
MTRSPQQIQGERGKDAPRTVIPGRLVVKIYDPCVEGMLRVV